MVSEEAKVKTFDVLQFVADNAGLSTFEAIEKAYNMGVSEQKAVFDKIKAEIIENSIKDYEYHGCGTDELIIETSEVLRVLDKYKAKSEG